jgi:hypothetical protein
VAPVFLRLRNPDFRPGPWNLGRWSRPVGWTAVVWVVIITFTGPRHTVDEPVEPAEVDAG